MERRCVPVEMIPTILQTLVMYLQHENVKIMSLDSTSINTLFSLWRALVDLMRSDVPPTREHQDMTLDSTSINILVFEKL